MARITLWGCIGVERAELPYRCGLFYATFGPNVRCGARKLSPIPYYESQKVYHWCLYSVLRSYNKYFYYSCCLNRRAEEGSSDSEDDRTTFRENIRFFSWPRESRRSSSTTYSILASDRSCRNSASCRWRSSSLSTWSSLVVKVSRGVDS